MAIITCNVVIAHAGPTSYILDNSENMELSGLTLCQGQLLTVSDSDTNTIFSIDEKSGLRAFFYQDGIEVPHANYPFPKNILYSLYKLVSSGLDLEGISCYNNNIYLLSELHSAIYNVTKREWIYLDLSKVFEAGYFDKNNAFFEGIAVTDRYIYLAAEREPRGIIRYELETGALKIGPPEFREESSKPMDYSGLYYFQDELYALYRNAHKVCQIDKDALVPSKCHYLDGLSDIKYGDSVYGLAEGLAIDQDYIYIVLDNNKEALSGASHNRATLFRTKNPFGNLMN